MKKKYKKPLVSIVSRNLKVHVLITLSSGTQKNENALGRGSDNDFNDDDY